MGPDHPTLVSLERADEVPPDTIGQSSHFHPQFLSPILAEDALSGIESLLQRGERPTFANRHDLDPIHAPTSPCRGCRHSLPDLLQTDFHIHGIHPIVAIRDSVPVARWENHPSSHLVHPPADHQFAPGAWSRIALPRSTVSLLVSVLTV